MLEPDKKKVIDEFTKGYAVVLGSEIPAKIIMQIGEDGEMEISEIPIEKGLWFVFINAPNRGFPPATIQVLSNGKLIHETQWGKAKSWFVMESSGCKILKFRTRDFNYGRFTCEVRAVEFDRLMTILELTR